MEKLYKHFINSIHDVLTESDVPTPSPWDYSITDSTVAPFSDHLMLSIIVVLPNIGILTYGEAWLIICEGI